MTVYDGTKTHYVPPSDCRMISHVYEEFVHTDVHTLGENAAEMSSASVNRLALDIYSLQSRSAVYRSQKNSQTPIPRLLGHPRKLICSVPRFSDTVMICVLFGVFCLELI